MFNGYYSFEHVDISGDFENLKGYVTGPRHTPFEGCVLEFSITIPDNLYLEPAQVELLTEVYLKEMK